MEKWVVFASYWKSRKLLLMLLTMFCWAEVLPKKVWETFWANPCLQRWFLACVILECFVNFLDDPFYEPLPWFMIVACSLQVQLACFCLVFHTKNLLHMYVIIVVHISSMHAHVQCSLLWSFNQFPCVVVCLPIYHISGAKDNQINAMAVLITFNPWKDWCEYAERLRFYFFANSITTGTKKCTITAKSAWNISTIKATI